MIPPRSVLAVSPALTRVLLAVVAEHHDHGRATVRSVAARADLSIRVTHQHLVRLRRRELVAFEDGRAGTLRPTVQVVAHTPSRSPQPRSSTA